MKHLLIVIFLFLNSALFGQVSLDDLPKPVARVVKNSYKKQEVTVQKINSARHDFQGDSFYAIYTGNSTDPAGYLHFGSVNTCRTGGCSGPGEPAKGDFSSEYFDYLIIYDTGLSVETVQVFNYQASYGHEIAARGWLNQFSGFKGEISLEPGKNIDVISGATVSVHAITEDVEWKTKLLQQMIQ